MKNIFSIILILVSIGTYFAYIHPTYGKATGAAELEKKSIKELLADKTNYNDALHKTQQIEKVHNGLLDQFNSIPDAEKERIEKLIPDHIDSVRLVIEIRNIAKDRSLEVTDISINTGSGSGTGQTGGRVSSSQQAGSVPVSPQKKKYDSVEFGFVIEGSYQDFLDFLTDIEKSLRIVDLTSVEFDSTEDDVYKFNLKFKTYLLK